MATESEETQMMWEGLGEGQQRPRGAVSPLVRWVPCCHSCLQQTLLKPLLCARHGAVRLAPRQVPSGGRGAVLGRPPGPRWAP